MKHIVHTMAIAIITLTLIGCGAANPEKLMLKQAQQKAKELTAQGWKIDDSYRTLDVAIFEHIKKKHAYQSQNSEEMQEITGIVSMCKSTNVCKANAQFNALREYARFIGTKIVGKLSGSIDNNASAQKPEEQDTFGEKVMGYVEATTNRVLMPSYSIVKEGNNGKEYQTIFTVDERRASEAVKEALKRSIEETKLSIEKSKAIEEYVNDELFKKHSK